ncbi:hypothetical protein PVAND_004182 [Polypedilum vanderplanki]|uniref:Transposase domain-containing protein n=1 Tax=Polypedilum vanderplanki TaxID=319348 RepID=A0A9J6BWX5_POLVA|nr:hypothetical protein PVAND_004182 [Polypedilum vanderplanki]
MAYYKIYEDLSTSGKRKRIKRNSEFCNDEKIMQDVQNYEDLQNILFEPEVFPLSLHNKLEHDNADTNFIKIENKEAPNISFEKSLAKWAVDFNINRNAVTALLHLLKNDRYPNLPNDSRSLLNTPRITEVSEISPGKYIYIGLRKSLITLLNYENNIPTTLFIDINCDGAPIYKNSNENGSLWPILCHVKNLNSPVFPIALYGGPKKPDDFSLYLMPFVEEYNEIYETFVFDSKLIKIKINNIILDAPARSAVCCIAGHTGHNACPKCYAVAKTINSRSVYSEQIYHLRTNEQFRLKIDNDFHKGTSPFEQIKDLDMVSNFPIDYFHCVLLGIMRKLLSLWFDTKGLYPASTKARISAKIKLFINCQPNDFQRKLRGLEKMNMYKGTELRTFLLFIGPYVLKNEISTVHYNNFILLHSAITILIHAEFCIKYNSIADEIIRQFVNDAREIYGESVITYNFHLVTHLSQDCLLNGPLDNFASYKFESFLGKLKTYVKNSNNPITQIANRMQETLNVDAFLKRSKNESEGYDFILKNPIKNQFNKYKKLIYNQRVYMPNKKDCYAILNDFSVIEILHFVKNEISTVVNCKRFKNLTNIYEFPIDSGDIMCHKICINNFDIVSIDIRNIRQKMYATPVDESNIFVFPLSYE